MHVALIVRRHGPSPFISSKPTLSLAFRLSSSATYLHPTLFCFSAQFALVKFSSSLHFHVVRASVNSHLLAHRPLSERKTLLRKRLPRKPRALVYVQHFASGTDLFRLICERDMEGVVAKQASARYTPETTTWVKIKNRQYSQAVGREDFFSVRRRTK